MRFNILSLGLVAAFYAMSVVMAADNSNFDHPRNTNSFNNINVSENYSNNGNNAKRGVTLSRRRMIHVANKSGAVFKKRVNENEKEENEITGDEFDTDEN